MDTYVGYDYIFVQCALLPYVQTELINFSHVFLMVYCWFVESQFIR